DLVDVQHGQRFARGVDGRATVGSDLCVIAHAAQYPVGDPGRAPRSPGDLRHRVVVDLDVEEAGRPGHDPLELRLGVEVQAVDGAEAVAQGAAEKALAGGG